MLNDTSQTFKMLAKEESKLNHLKIISLINFMNFDFS